MTYYIVISKEKPFSPFKLLSLLIIVIVLLHHFIAIIIKIKPFIQTVSDHHMGPLSDGNPLFYERRYSNSVTVFTRCSKNAL